MKSKKVIKENSLVCKTDLRNIPGVGKEIEKDLISLGYDSIASLKGSIPEEIYLKEERIKGVKIDRCMLYVYRLAVYFAENEKHDETKLKWWYWKDKEYPEK